MAEQGEGQGQGESSGQGNEQGQAQGTAQGTGPPETVEQARERIAELERGLSGTAKESQGYRTKLREAERELAELKEKSMGETEKAIEAARREERDKVTGEFVTRIVASEVLAAAGGKFRDPADALHHVDLADLVDEASDDRRKAAIAKALDALLESKPYLAVDANGQGGQGVVSQGVHSRMPGSSAGKTGDDSDWIRKARRTSRAT